MANVSVLGAGSWGTALALSLSRAGHDVLLWSHEPEHVEKMQQDRSNTQYLPDIPFPDNLMITHELSQAMAHAKTILVVVPSHAFRSLLERIKIDWTPSHELIWATKGLDASGQLLHSIVERVLGDSVKRAVLSGPSFAIEAANALPTAVTIASTDEVYARVLAVLFNTEHFRVYVSDDIIGAELGGAVKNILAIACGISDGVGFGANARAALITRGLAEMMRLGCALSAQADTFMGLSGIGDLVLTCTDDKSRNRRYGLALGQGISPKQAQLQIGQVVEGILTASHVYKLAQKYHVDMPIVEQVYHVLQGECHVSDAVKVLLSRPLKSETS